MKKHILIVVIVISLITAISFGSEPPLPTVPDDDQALPGVELARTIATVTGVAISPLFGVSAVGAWNYFKTPPAERDSLPWHSSLWFWLPALVAGLLILAKEPVLGWIPGIKKPLDALELFESKASALVATPIVIPMILAAFSNPATQAFLSPGTGRHVLVAGAPFSLGFLGQFSSVAGSVFFAIAALIGFFVVWMAFHAINVLIFLSPFGFLDMFLRAIKIVVLVLIAGSTLIHPYLGLVVCLSILLACIPVACWSFRLSVFGTVLAWDLLTGKHRNIGNVGEKVLAFATGRTDPAPTRTLGYLSRSEENGLQFVYRPWRIFGQKHLDVPRGRMKLGRGAICTILMVLDDADEDLIMALRLPPRYRGHEDHLVSTFGLDGVVDLPIRKGVKALWAWLSDMTGRVTSGVRKATEVFD